MVKEAPWWQKLNKIFLSWSGETSRQLAIAFFDWLPTVLQGVRPFMSQADIRSGARWFTTISSELESNSFGLLFMTSENTSAEWIMFEAGAISKLVGQSYVCPIVFNVTFTDLVGPLREFQSKEFTKEGMLQLVKDINVARNEAAIDTVHLEVAFNRGWPELEVRVSEILETQPLVVEAQTRTSEDKIDEILELLRGMARSNVRESSSGNLLRHYIDRIIYSSPGSSGPLTEESDSDSEGEVDPEALGIDPDAL